jgi:mono/diheme cytochrome c family protein
MKRTLQITFFVLLAALSLVAAARGSVPQQGSLPGDALRGARLYDNWMLVLDQMPPTGNQPLWNTQDANARGGAVTWRCVECHGWDYKGEEGAYGPFSSHYTGFPGLGNSVGASQDDVLDWLNGSNNPEHNFLPITSVIALNDLAAFLRTQQIDVDLLIDPTTGAGLGNRVQGQELYRESCAGCHGEDGDQINFGTTLNPFYVGDLAVSNPWRAVHFTRFGNPFESHFASEQENWSLTNVADLLNYTQTLKLGDPLSAPPTAEQELDVERQGELAPIVWAGLGMLLVVAGSWTWDLIQQRKLSRQ